ncbi:MAG: hypothetical protein NWE98_02035 [Candidatus Bathyarchaeota archaeon]|nr:hypothetical protein [Candidatus Bathyarchaeota archaeon]
MNKITLSRIIVISMLVLLIFLGFSTVANELDQNNRIFSVIRTFFNTGTILFVVAILRNVSGFALEWFKTDLKETYNETKLYATLTYYVGLIPSIAAIGSTLNFTVAGVSIGEISAFLLIFADVAIQAIKTLFKK